MNIYFQQPEKFKKKKKSASKFKFYMYIFIHNVVPVFLSFNRV